MPMNKVVHAAQRAAFSAAISAIETPVMDAYTTNAILGGMTIAIELDVAINAVRGKGTEKLSENAVKLVNLAEPLLKDRYPASAFDAARKFVSDPNGKWMQYAYRAINEIDPHVLKMNALNLVYEGMFSGYNYVCELRKKYDCNMPWILLFDPTSACNLHCKGCWAAEYGNRLNLTYEEMDKLVTEGEELGIHRRRADVPQERSAQAGCQAPELRVPPVHQWYSDRRCFLRGSQESRQHGFLPVR